MYVGNSTVNIVCFRRLALSLLKRVDEPKNKTISREMYWCAGIDEYRHDVFSEKVNRVCSSPWGSVSLYLLT